MERLLLPKMIPSMIVGTVSIPRQICGFANSFCSGYSTGSQAVGDAFRCIGVGDADVLITGSAEHNLDPILMTGFSKANYGLNLHADKDPSKACMPFD